MKGAAWPQADLFPAWWELETFMSFPVEFALVYCGEVGTGGVAHSRGIPPSHPMQFQVDCIQLRAHVGPHSHATRWDFRRSNHCK